MVFLFLGHINPFSTIGAESPDIAKYTQNYRHPFIKFLYPVFTFTSRGYGTEWVKHTRQKNYKQTEKQRQWQSFQGFRSSSLQPIINSN